jgi:hypothetical protein
MDLHPFRTFTSLPNESVYDGPFRVRAGGWKMQQQTETARLLANVKRPIPHACCPHPT